MFLELQKDPEDIYLQLRKVVEQVNAVIGTYASEGYQLDPVSYAVPVGNLSVNDDASYANNHLRRRSTAPSPSARASTRGASRSARSPASLRSKAERTRRRYAPNLPSSYPVIFSLGLTLVDHLTVLFTVCS